MPAAQDTLGKPYQGSRTGFSRDWPAPGVSPTGPRAAPMKLLSVLAFVIGAAPPAVHAGTSLGASEPAGRIPALPDPDAAGYPAGRGQGQARAAEPRRDPGPHPNACAANATAPAPEQIARQTGWRGYEKPGPAPVTHSLPD